MSAPTSPDREAERLDLALNHLAGSRLRRRALVGAIVQAIEKLRENSRELRHFAEAGNVLPQIETFIAGQDSQMECALMDYLEATRK